MTSRGRGSLGAAAVCLGGIALLAQPRPPDFSREVAPIFTRSCLSCHSTAQPMSQLDLSTRTAALKGGQKSGAAIIPGDSARSPLYRRLTGQDKPAMPLGGKLTDSEITIIRNWIDSGAAWDGVLSAAPAPAANTEKTFSDQDRAWWAFRKPVRHTIPQVSESRWKTNPIDAFLKKSLDDQ